MSRSNFFWRSFLFVEKNWIVIKLKLGETPIGLHLQEQLEHPLAKLKNQKITLKLYGLEHVPHGYHFCEHERNQLVLVNTPTVEYP